MTAPAWRGLLCLAVVLPLLKNCEALSFHHRHKPKARRISFLWYLADDLLGEGQHNFAISLSSEKVQVQHWYTDHHVVNSTGPGHSWTAAGAQSCPCICLRGFPDCRLALSSSVSLALLSFRKELHELRINSLSKTCSAPRPHNSEAKQT